MYTDGRVYAAIVSIDIRGNREANISGFAAAVVERPPMESLWSLYNLVMILICSGCLKKKNRFYNAVKFYRHLE